MNMIGDNYNNWDIQYFFEIQETKNERTERKGKAVDMRT